MGNAPAIMICVGATKAGTTWLHDQLAQRPDCHLRSIKEYHYFNTFTDAQWDRKIADTRAEIAVLTARAPLDIADARRLDDLRAWLPVLQQRRIDPARFADFLQGSAPVGTALVGDFTPAYSIMPGHALRPILAMGALKVVYLIRDPLARLWSHVRMSAQRAAPANFEATCAKTMQSAISGVEDGETRGILRRGDYAAILPKLNRIFGAQLLVMFTEDLLTAVGYQRLLAFLGLPATAAAPDLGKRVHEGRDLLLPAHLRRAALAFLRPQYDFIASEFTHLPQVWRDMMAEMTPSPQTLKA